jgi:hypothetical protein
MRFFFFLQTLNLYPNKQKYKVNKRNTLLQETGGKKKGNKRKKKKNLFQMLQQLARRQGRGK